MHAQLWTEDEVGARVGLPGPLVAEILQAGVQTSTVIHSQAPQYCDGDVMRAQVAALMLACGVRWHLVQAAVRHAPTTPEDLRRTRDFWSGIAPDPLHPRCWPFVAGAVATALMVLSLLIGIAIGSFLNPLGLP
jgi:hypothetical protein